MNLCLLFLASLALTANTASSSAINPNTSLPLSSFAVDHRCASPAPPIAGRRTPTALDCLNVLTFILATTPNHNQPTKWSQLPGHDHITLPYRRSSGTCELLVRLNKHAPPSAIDISSVDHVVGNSMRLIEVCLLYGKPDVEQSGGRASAGAYRYMDVVIWGAPDSGGNGGALSNRTGTLAGPGPLLTEISQA